MTHASGTTPLPPSSTPVVRKGWQHGVAPQYIALFLWVVYFDQLGRRTLAVGGLLPSVLGAAAAGLLCYLLLYYGPAMWGFRSGQPFAVLCRSTFGATGSRWLGDVLLGLGQIVWFALATSYATGLTLQGLVSCRLMQSSALLPIRVWGMTLPSILFLFTSLVWCYAAALVGHYLVSIIAALMKVYPMFMALMLGVATLWTLRGVPQFQPLEVDPATGAPIVGGGLQALTMMIELVFGFFATAGALAADWGAVNRTERDVRLGGLVGVAFASVTVATLALLTVAGAVGDHLMPAAAGPRITLGAETFSYRFRDAVNLAIGGKLTAAIFLIFGLGSLAPTCYAVYIFGHRFAAAWPRIRRLRWSLIGATAAWVLIAAGCEGRLETIFALMGAVFAPLVAALTADFLRQRGGWAGARRGINWSGVLAWSAGLAVGLVPVVARAAGWAAGTRFQPAAVFAYFTALAVYLALAALGGEAPIEPAIVAETVQPADAASPA